MIYLAVLHLYSGVPLEYNGENQALYPNEEMQRQLGKYQLYEFVNLSFVRANNETVIRLPSFSNNYARCNYLEVNNTDYYSENGVTQIFGFITRVEYINDNCTYIHWRQDYFRTWSSLLDFGDCLIERANVNPEYDKIGAYLQPEPVNIPMYEYTQVIDKIYPYEWHLYASEVPWKDAVLPGSWRPVKPGADGNEYSACWRYDSENLRDIQQLVESFSTHGRLEAIIAVFASVKIEQSTFDFPINKNEINGVFVNNMKCFTYPYCAVVIAGPGFSKSYRLEKFATIENLDKVQFNLKTIIEPNGQILITPENYNGSNMAHTIVEDAIMFGGFRQAAYSANTFMNSLVQNVPSLAISAASAALAGDAATGVFAANAITDIYKDSLVQHNISGIAAASSVVFSDNVNFTVGFKCPSADTVRRLDDYFTMFGYNLQTIGNPMDYFNERGDRPYTYIKTRDVEVHGQIPNDAKEYIMGLFNKGIRLWRNVEDIGKYPRLV